MCHKHDLRGKSITTDLIDTYFLLTKTLSNINTKYTGKQFTIFRVLLKSPSFSVTNRPSISQHHTFSTAVKALTPTKKKPKTTTHGQVWWSTAPHILSVTDWENLVKHLLAFSKWHPAWQPGGIKQGDN